MATMRTADREILRGLAEQKAEIARLPVQQERFQLWGDLNSLKARRPMVHLKPAETPWHELSGEEELKLRCQDSRAQWIETRLRQELYQWRHMPGDMLVEGVWYVPYVCGPQSSYADYGIKEQHRVAEGGQDVGYEPVIHSEKDVEALRAPEVWVDWAKTEEEYQFAGELFAGLLEVRKRGIAHEWCAPWDQMIHWYGIEQLYMDMVDRPELVHLLLRRFTDALLHVLRQQEALGLLDVGNGNYNRGSGGLAVCAELPDAAGRPAVVKPCHQWGCSTGQIFSEVSPEMHEEFCLRYEIEWLRNFGLNYYGCCEPLHRKMGILRKVPHLRAISMSPWINLTEAVEAVRGDYVFSFKPNPAMLASERWDPKAVESYLRDVLTRTRGCHVELVLKDITTVRRDPRRLWAWSEIATRLAQEFAR